MVELPPYTYYRIINVGGHSDAILLEYHDPHKNVLKALISVRRVRVKPSISIPFPLRITSWFQKHKELLDLFPRRMLVVIPFNVTTETDIDIIAEILKALYRFRSVDELYREGIRAGKLRPADSDLEEHYRQFLTAQTFPRIPVSTFFKLLRTIPSQLSESEEEKAEGSTP